MPATWWRTRVRALVTSLNLTRKCFGKTCDAIAITHDPGVVKGLRDLMASDRDGGAISGDASGSDDHRPGAGAESRLPR